MATQKIFGVWDDVAESFVSVFVAPDDGSAVRLFRNACLDSATLLAKDPSSYALYACGDLDPATHSFGRGLGRRISRALDHTSQVPVAPSAVTDAPVEPPHISDVQFENRG